MSALIFDTELTDRKNGEIIEAAWLALTPREDLAGTPDVIDLTVQGERCYRFKPQKPITSGARAVHHILDYELEHCPPSSSFRLPDDTAYVIGHSIDTDWVAAGSPAHVKRIDTHAIAQWLWPEATGYSQSALIYELEGATRKTREMLKDAHNALADVRLNYVLVRNILSLNPDIVTWSQFWRYSEECRIPRTCPLKRWEGVLLEDMDDGAISWCLNQHWIDPYFRLGLERALERRHSAFMDHEVDDERWTLPAHVESRYPNNVEAESSPDDLPF